ncbi:MAG: DUF6531 domain-containing protein, partial [Syntrophales bacterium]
MEFLEVLSNYLQSFRTFRKKKERGTYNKVIAVIILTAFIVSTTNMVYIPQAFAAIPQTTLPKATKTFFEEGFDGTSIDSTKWNIDIATAGERALRTGGWVDISSEVDDDLIQLPPYGSITVNGGEASFSAGRGRAFPYIWSGPPSRTSPFPDTGDFILEVRMKYDTISPHGDGLQAIYSDPEGYNPPAGGGIFDIWADSASSLRVNTINNWVSVSDSLSFHDYKLEYIDGKYSLYIDGILKVEPTTSSLRPNTITIGNPVFASWVAAQWTDFTVDYIRVTAVNLKIPEIKITEPQNMTSVNGIVPVSAKGINTDSLSLTISDNATGTVVFQDTVTQAENTWLWDSTGVIDGTYLINVQGINSMGNSAEDQVLVEVQNAVPSIGVSPFQAVNNYGLNAQQSGIVNYNGNLLLQGNDLTLSNNPVPLAVSRYYNSMQSNKGELGAGWHPGIPYLTPKLNGTVLYSNETGKIFEFIADANGSYKTPAGIRFRLYKQADGTYKLEHPASYVTWQFAVNGLLRTVIDQNGNKVQYSYNGYKISKIT